MDTLTIGEVVRWVATAIGLPATLYMVWLVIRLSREIGKWQGESETWRTYFRDQLITIVDRLDRQNGNIAEGQRQHLEHLRDHVRDS